MNRAPNQAIQSIINSLHTFPSHIEASDPDSPTDIINSLTITSTSQGINKFPHTAHRKIFKNLLDAHRFIRDSQIIDAEVNRLPVNGGEWEIIYRTEKGE